MADSPIDPTMQDILARFQRLSERIGVSPTDHLDPFVSVWLRRASEELHRFIPGLDIPPNGEAATLFVSTATASLSINDYREALSLALWGLSFAPHDPELWFIVATACVEYGALEDAFRALRHTLWIYPGHALAKSDLEALTKYLRGKWDVAGHTRYPDGSFGVQRRTPLTSSEIGHRFHDEDYGYDDDEEYDDER